MTSKIENKIIIDGVDVSKCRYYHCKACTANNFGKCDSSPEIYKNCYYKQLKRTELAFENLKRRGTIPMVFIDSKLIDKYKQALEEIRKEANRLLYEENPIYGYNNSNYFELLAKYVLAKTKEVLEDNEDVENN